MRIKIFNDIIWIVLFTFLLMPAVCLFESNTIRVIIGLPFILFFPGYTLISALFPDKEGLSRIKRIALSFAVSLMVVGFTGIGLNYTSWGISPRSYIFSVTAFIVVFSAISLIRRASVAHRIKFTYEIELCFPVWTGTILNRILMITLVVCTISTVGIISYLAVVPRAGEKFTQFYLLGTDGEAQNYPHQFYLEQGLVTGVSYGSNSNIIETTLGKVRLGIINNESSEVVYTVEVNIQGQATDIFLDGISYSQLGPIDLLPEQKWEQEVGFAPAHLGSNQKVEFLLYKDGAPSPDNSLHLWVTAIALQQ